MTANPAKARMREWAIASAIVCYALLVAIVPRIEIKAALCVPLLVVPFCWWLLCDAGRWLATFFVVALLMPPLPIEIGNSGPHLALVIAGCGLLIGVIHLGAFRVRFNRLSVSLLALFAILAASIFMAAMYSGPVTAAGSLARVVLFGISVYVFFYVSGCAALWRGAAADRIVRLLFWGAVGSAAFACLDFYFQFPAPAGYGPQFIWLDSGIFRRAQGFFYEAGTLGNLCACFLELIAVMLSFPAERRPLAKISMITGGSLLAAALVLSYSRASLVNLGVALAVLAWLNRARIRIGRTLISVAIFAAAASVIIVGAFPVFAQAYWQRISVSATYFFESPNGVLSGRIQSWDLLANFLIVHPWHAIFGVGYKTLAYSNFIGAATIADNTYLSMLIETGIFGLAALLIWNANIVRATYRAACSENSRRSFFGTWMLCFWCGQMAQMFSVDLLTYWRVLPVYMCAIALAVKEEA